MTDRARPGLVAFYDIRLGNGAGLFLQPAWGERQMYTNCLTTCQPHHSTTSLISMTNALWPSFQDNLVKPSLWHIILNISLHFNRFFPGGPGLAGTRMSPFWILLELRVMEVVSGDNWSWKTCKAPVKMSPPTNQHPVSFTGRMSFQSPNQQCQNTKGIISNIIWKTSDGCHHTVVNYRYGMNTAKFSTNTENIQNHIILDTVITEFRDEILHNSPKSVSKLMFCMIFDNNSSTRSLPRTSTLANTPHVMRTS